MMREFRKALALCVLAMMLPVAAAAQGNPTGGVQGKVTDGDGLALPGVTVTVTA